MKFYDFLIDPMLGALGAESYRTWHIVARLLDGDAHLLTADELIIAQQITGRSRFSSSAVRRFFAGLGRRSGKTLFESRRAAYFLAQDYTGRLQRGEHAVVAAIATDKRQAALLINYTRACVLASPLLSQQLVHDTADTLEFAHKTVLEVHAASFRSTRGRTFAAVLMDEAAFLRSEESANPDIELVRAVTPGLATLGGALEVFSSLHMRRGVLWDAHRKHFGNDESASLFVQGETRLFNPTIEQTVIDEALADDPEAAQAEWLGNFRSDLSAAFDPVWIDAATDTGVFERARVVMLPEGRTAHYVAFTDPAGGSGRDSWSTRTVHLEGREIIDDAILEIRPPFNTSEAARRVAEFLGRYGVTHVMGDRYAGSWPADALRLQGIAYMPSEWTKSDIYRECVPLFSSGRVRLLDHPRTCTQLRMLERRTRSGGTDGFDHPQGGNDDNANALCGALLCASRAGVHLGSDQTDAVESSLAPLLLPGVIGAPTYHDSRVSMFDHLEQMSTYDRHLI